MGIAKNLTPKELQLANLVDHFNDSFTGTNYKRSLKRGHHLKNIIMSLVLALDDESTDTDYLVKSESCMRLYKNNKEITHREFYDALEREKSMKDNTVEPTFDLERICQESVVSEKIALDNAFSRLEAPNINWKAVDAGARGHPARNIISMLEMNRHYVMHPEDRANSKIRILSYGKRAIELNIITQSYFDDAVAEHDNEIEKAIFERELSNE